jgi:general secretion pathway protein G
MRQQRDDSGFTLIEILVVIVILGILAAVVSMAVSGITDRGQTSADKTDTRTLRTAEEAYFASATSAAKYTAEATLVPRFLSEESTLHDICLSPNNKAYVVVAQLPAGDACASVTVPNP